jgi:hypothetical protein
MPECQEAAPLQWQRSVTSFFLVFLLVCVTSAAAQDAMKSSGVIMRPSPSVVVPPPLQPGDILRVELLGTVTQIVPPCTPANLVRLLAGVLAQVGQRETGFETHPEFPGGSSATIPDTRSPAQVLRDRATEQEASAPQLRARADVLEAQQRLLEEARQAVETCTP